MSTRLSVIVPIFNVESYLSKCLDSLISQTIKIHEILLVDDGSTDASSDIARMYSENDSKFKYFKKSNGGLSDARNHGIEHSTGDFLAFIDSDDYIDSTMFEKLLSKQHETNSDIVACDMVYVYEDGHQNIAIAGDFDVVDVKKNINFLGVNNSACNKIFRKELFDDIRFPKGKSYEDLFVVPILLFNANHVARVPEPLYMYIQRKGSIVHFNNKNMFHIYEAIDNIENELESKAFDLQFFDRIIKTMLIQHGLFLTTLRIKNNGDFKNRIEYFALNMDQLTKRYKEWYTDPSIKSYTFKTRVIFYLLKTKQYRLTGILLKKE